MRFPQSHMWLDSCSSTPISAGLRCLLRSRPGSSCPPQPPRSAPDSLRRQPAHSRQLSRRRLWRFRCPYEAEVYASRDVKKSGAKPGLETKPYDESKTSASVATTASAVEASPTSIEVSPDVSGRRISRRVSLRHPVISSAPPDDVRRHEENHHRSYDPDPGAPRNPADGKPGEQGYENPNEIRNRSHDEPPSDTSSEPPLARKGNMCRILRHPYPPRR
jgi:hypothetical protein